MVDYWVYGIPQWTALFDLTCRAWQIESWCTLNKKYKKVPFWHWQMLSVIREWSEDLWANEEGFAVTLWQKRPGKRWPAEWLASAGDTVGRIGFVSLWLITGTVDDIGTYSQYELFHSCLGIWCQLSCTVCTVGCNPQYAVSTSRRCWMLPGF